MARLDGICKRGHDTNDPAIGFPYEQYGRVAVRCRECVKVTQGIKATICACPECPCGESVMRAGVCGFCATGSHTDPLDIHPK